MLQKISDREKTLAFWVQLSLHRLQEEQRVFGGFLHQLIGPVVAHVSPFVRRRYRVGKYLVEGIEFGITEQWDENNHG